MSNPVALVTGGYRRVGRAISLAFAANGYDVAVHFRSSAADAEAVASEVRARGVRAATFGAELTDPAQARSLIDSVVDDHGRLDVLVNNAATFERVAVLDSPDDEWERAWSTSLATNLVAPARLARLAAPHLARAQGAIINLIDINASLAWAGYTAHGASKAGLAHLTRTLAVALGPEIRVNGVSPGIAMFPPDMPLEQKQALVDKTALGRAGTADDIAESVVFLARQAYTTGAVLPVDGGWSVPR